MNDDRTGFFSSATMGEIYAENKDEDSFLYIAYGGENTFGQLERQ